MNKKEVNIINLRPIFISAIMLLLGILFTYNVKIYLSSSKVTFGFVLPIIFLFAIIAWLVICVVLYFINKHNHSAKPNKIMLQIITTVFAILFFVAGSLYTNYKYSYYNSYIQLDGQYTITARVVSKTYKNGYTSCVISDINLPQQNVKLKSDATLYLYMDTEDLIQEGDTISCQTRITTSQLLDNTSKYVHDIVYTMSGTNNVEILSHNGLKLDESIRLNVKNALLANMNNENAGIAYSALFGSKDLLTDDLRNAFSYSGLSHILAVSGLHIGFLVAVITFVLSKCKVNKYIRLVIMTVVLAFYSYICGFTPSVLRASIMSIILLLSGIWGAEYDGLNSLSIAMIIILFINPFQLFDIGFILSFVSVFSIITMAGYIKRLLRQIKLPDKIASMLAITIATNIGICFVSIKYFNSFGLLGVFSNLIALPVFSVAYVILFTITIFVLFIPVFAKLYIVPECLLHIVKTVASYVSSLPFSVIRLFKVSFIVIFIILAIMYMCHFVMINKAYKRAISLLLISISFVILIVNNLPARFNTNAIYYTYQKQSNFMFITTTNNKRLLVNCDNNNRYLDQFMLDQKVTNIDYLIISDLNITMIDHIKSVVESYNIPDIIVVTKDTNIKKLTKDINHTIFADDVFSVCDISFTPMFYNNQTVALDIKANNSRHLLFNSNTTLTSIRRLNTTQLYDYVYLNNNMYSADISNYINYKNVITSYNLSCPNKFVLRYQTNFTYNF